jgi:hypothetical protein
MTSELILACRPVRGTMLQMDDADIRQAIRAVLSAVQLNTGFRCSI